MYLHDDYCPDQKVLDWLRAEERWRTMTGKFHWWDGWWQAEAKNNWEYIIKMIWQSQGVESTIAGFEYWCNILDATSGQNYLGWHRDKDERLKAESGRLITPMIGTVFYGYPHKIDGGYLEIAQDPSLSEVERISAQYNRIVIFDVAKQHRVSKVYRGQRFSMQINLWKKKPETFRDANIVPSAM